MDITLIKSLPKKVAKLISAPSKTPAFWIYLGFIALLYVLSILNLPNYLKVISLLIGSFILGDILHFLKSKYVNRTN